MAYYFIDLMVIEDESYCFIKDAPDGTEELTYRMARGFRMGDEYPSDARVRMARKYPGFQTPSIIGNTNSFLIVDRQVKGIIEACCENEIEWLPLSIYDHRDSLASADHFIANPIGSVDCLDLGASTVVYSGQDIARVNDHVIDAERAKEGGHLFRIKDDPRRYVISDVLAERLQELGATNLKLVAIKESSSGPA